MSTRAPSLANADITSQWHLLAAPLVVSLSSVQSIIAFRGLLKRWNQSGAVLSREIELAEIDEYEPIDGELIPQRVNSLQGRICVSCRCVSGL